MKCPRLDCNGTMKNANDWHNGVMEVRLKGAEERNFLFCVLCGCVIYKKEVK